MKDRRPIEEMVDLIAFITLVGSLAGGFALFLWCVFARRD